MIRLRTLGALDLRNSEGQELRAVLAQPKRAALLAYLVLATPRRPHRRDTLLALFWPEQDTEHARNALSQAVHFLRRSLGNDSLVASNGDGLALGWKDVWCDAVAFEDALEVGRPSDALDFYRGDLLEGFHVGDAPEFEHWLEAERRRLFNRYAKAVEDLAEEQEAVADYEGAARWWRRLAARDPYSSRVALRLMRALADAGDPGQAVQYARAHEKLLREELEMAPDPEVAALARHLQSSRAGEQRRHPDWPARPASRVVVGNPSPPSASVVVLPFLNLSGEREDEYFSEGMTEEILNALAKIPELKVASRTSVFAFRGKNLDIREIADRLSVRVVLEGSVRRAGDRVRITAQLINAADGYHLWSETYDREVRDVFAVQDEISRAIVNALEIRLSRAVPTTVVRSGTANVEAYELYLRGRFFWNVRTPESLQKGIGCFERAAAVDPAYALPHSGMADCYHLLALYGMMRARDAYPKAKAAALRAIAINDRMAEGHSSLGCVALAYEYEWTAAEREFRRAIELDPSYAPAHHWYAWFLTAMNRRDEAAEVVRRAVELEPLSTAILARAGHILYYAGQPQEGLRFCERALELDPDSAPAYEVLALIHSRLGRLKEAVAALDALGTRPPSRAGPVLRPYVQAMAGNMVEARAMLDGLSLLPEAGRAPAGYLPLWVCATHALLGNRDTAFRWLAWMYEERSFGILFCHTQPGYDRLRSDPRFDQWLTRIGLPDPEITTPVPRPQSARTGEEQRQPKSTAQPAESMGASAAPALPESDQESLAPHLDELGLTADELCARGRQGLYQFTAKSFAEGMRHAERAIQLDPYHAEAHVTLGSLYIMVSQATRAGDPRLRGIDLCRHAAALDPQLAEAELWLAYASQLDERFEDAEALALRGLELDPDGLFSHSILAGCGSLMASRPGAGRSASRASHHS